MTPLCELAKLYGSDKGGGHLIAGDTCHQYTSAYHELFKNRREQVQNVLEIGINYGCSLRMWQDYFPNAQIIGLDSNEECLRNYGERVRCFAADQYNERDLMAVLDVLAPVRFDLIVDDASHVDEHQIFSAQCLLPHLAKDGYYIVEDLNIDCKPELIGEPIVRAVAGFEWTAIPTGRGLGKAFCMCGCGGGEQLLVLQWQKSS